MAKPNAEASSDALWVSVESACLVWGLPQHLVEKWVKDGRFPPPRQFNARVVRYPRDVIKPIHKLIQYGWLPVPNGQPDEDPES